MFCQYRAHPLYFGVNYQMHGLFSNNSITLGYVRVNNTSFQSQYEYYQ